MHAGNIDANFEIFQPCTNCVAFSIECKIPTPKRKKTQAGKQKDSDRYGYESTLTKTAY